MQTEDEIGARQDYQDSLREELRQKLSDDEEVKLGEGFYINYSTVLDNINSDYYKHAVNFVLSPSCSNLANRCERLMDDMKESALNFTVNFYIAHYASQQIKDAQDDY